MFPAIGLRTWKTLVKYTQPVDQSGYSESTVGLLGDPDI